MPQTRLRILLLCDDRPGNANTILDHINAFGRYSRHDVSTFNPRGMRRSWLLDLDEFDVVVIHYSLVLSDERHVSHDFRRMLERYRGLKVQFIQDEYRWVDRATAASRNAGIDVLFTAAPEPAAGLLYDERLPGVRRVHTLTGYVPDHLSLYPRRAPAERTIDVGYRGRDLPFWLGRLTQEKQWIGQGFLERAPAHGLATDIAWTEQDRIYGDQWIDFIASCRATLGTESGASIADFDGEVESRVRTFLRGHRSASFEEVADAVLRPYEGNVVVNVISPRVFEAASLGTALVMFPGEYSGVVQPGEHYIVLEKDFSNMDEVASKLKDGPGLAELVQRTHEHVIASGLWSYATFIYDFDAVVADATKSTRRRYGKPRRRLAGIERAVRVPAPHVRLTRAALTVMARVRGRDFARRSEIESWAWLAKATMAIRAALSDSDLRSIFSEGRKSGMALDAVLEEILELHLLQRSGSGDLRSRRAFTVEAEYDQSSNTLRFLSKSAAEGAGAGPTSPVVLDAVRVGSVDAIEWDHTAIGPTVELVDPYLEVGVGSDGHKRFGPLVQLGRRRPDLLERVLAPVMGGREPATSDRF
jgi:hypothetical protein